MVLEKLSSLITTCKFYYYACKTLDPKSLREHLGSKVKRRQFEILGFPFV